jgi:hypothetical protein
MKKHQKKTPHFFFFSLSLIEFLAKLAIISPVQKNSVRE